MTDSASGVCCTVTVPVEWQGALQGEDLAALALIRLHGLEALQAERLPPQDGHTSTPDWRTQAQLDLALDALRELQRHLIPLPASRVLTLSPGLIHVAVDVGPGWDSGASLGSEGWLKLWLDMRMPQPVLLPVSVADDGFAVRSVYPDLDAAVEALIFRLHRREVARLRRVGAPAPQR